MRSARDCLAKADDMDREASQCDTPALRDELIAMARTWRQLAVHALWQDRREVANPLA
ncbi:MAG: hypothetical protein KKC14_13955 [Alphaproteobacteria bacterium]|nr:hypothetical protein [Alphaproteobacteria bacterium]